MIDNQAAVKLAGQRVRAIYQSVKKLVRPEQIPSPLDTEPGYETGGFDIMKQLVKKQREHVNYPRVKTVGLLRSQGLCQVLRAPQEQKGD
jgi:hypothetical protein